jgi:DNA polymerase (family X)
MKQLEVADIFEEIAKLLELKGENPFRIRAYQRAALNIRNLPEDLQARVKAGTLEALPGIGKDLAQKIEEIMTTGKLSYLDRIKKEIPESLITLTGIPGLGPKTAKRVYDKFKVKSLEQLEALVRAGKLRELPGFKEKKEENILRGIQLLKAGQERMPLGIALKLGEEIFNELKVLKSVQQISLAGSLRRRKETVRDIDLLITSTHPKQVMEKFVNLSLVHQVQPNPACGPGGGFRWTCGWSSPMSLARRWSILPAPKRTTSRSVPWPTARG